MNVRSILAATAQTTVMFIAGLILPLLGQAIALFTPVPLILLFVRAGRREGMIALAASCAIVGFAGGWQTGAILFFSFGVMAIGTAEGMVRRWKPESAAVLGGMLPVIALSIVTAYYFSRMGKNPVVVIEEYLRSSMGEAAKLYTQMGLKEMSEALSTISDAFIHYLVRLIPGIAIATSVFQAACCYGLSKILISRKPGAAVPLIRTSFAQWHAPDVWVWGLIVALVLVLVPGETALFTGLNLAVVYFLIYLTQGAAVVDHYLRRARIQPFIRGVLHAIILALPTVVFVIALGIVDIWADFRKVRGPVLPPKS